MLSGLKIVLTGASGLTGPAITRRLFDSHSQLVIAGRDRKKLESCRSGLTNDSAVHIWCGDLTSEEECSLLIDFAANTMGGIDVLINNAAQFNFSAVENINYEKLNELTHINLQTPVYLTSLALPWLKANHHSVILNISSLAGQASLPDGACYAASKWGLQGFSYSIREALRNTPVHICTISPCQIEVLRSDNHKHVSAITPQALAESVALIIKASYQLSSSLDLVIR